jgi:hypothetical protein
VPCRSFIASHGSWPLATEAKPRARPALVVDLGLSLMLVSHSSPTISRLPRRRRTAIEVS